MKLGILTSEYPFHREFKNFKPHLSAIVQNEKIISAVFSIHCGTTFFYWIFSFDNSFKSISLGKLHIKLLIEIVFNRKLQNLISWWLAL